MTLAILFPSDVRLRMRFGGNVFLYSSAISPAFLPKLPAGEILKGLDAKYIKGELPFEMYIRIRSLYEQQAEKDAKRRSKRPEDIAYQ